ncbi:Uncharacterised protein [Bordetella pertussis]|nr:Uncharacterised protein [Bordetella pertussis]
MGLPAGKAGVQFDARAVVALGPVGHGHVFDTHHAAGAGRVDEAVFAHVDADMRVAPAQGVEEHQVARAQFLAVDVGAPAGDVGRDARQFQAQRALGGMGHQAAAIEAGIGRDAVEPVAHAKLAQRFADQRVLAAGLRLAGAPVALELLGDQDAYRIVGAGDPLGVVGVAFEGIRRFLGTGAGATGQSHRARYHRQQAQTAARQADIAFR